MLDSALQQGTIRYLFCTAVRLALVSAYPRLSLLMAALELDS